MHPVHAGIQFFLHFPVVFSALFRTCDLVVDLSERFIQDPLFFHDLLGQKILCRALSFDLLFHIADFPHPEALCEFFFVFLFCFFLHLFCRFRRLCHRFLLFIFIHR